ncbi:MAG: hypothetical protein U9Q06_01895 [Nanoarchaeota archaeon]|nr:hypothetical protein [Nanoarchaeota archaeon]
MSRLNNLYQSAKRHTGKIVAGVLMVGALAGMRDYAKNMGEEVYRGNINSQEVVYSEGVYDFAEGPFNRKNVMTIKKGDLTYILEDRREETNIDWKNNQKPSFESDGLDRVFICEESGIRTYGGLVPNPDTNTIDGKHAKEVLDRTNAIYNDLRAQIRGELRSEYEKEHKPLEEALKQQ